MLLIRIALLEVVKSSGYRGDAEKEEKEVHEVLLMLKAAAGTADHVL